MFCISSNHKNSFTARLRARYCRCDKSRIVDTWRGVRARNVLEIAIVRTRKLSPKMNVARGAHASLLLYASHRSKSTALRWRNNSRAFATFRLLRHLLARTRPLEMFIFFSHPIASSHDSPHRRTTATKAAYRISSARIAMFEFHHNKFAFNSCF